MTANILQRHVAVVSINSTCGNNLGLYRIACGQRFSHASRRWQSSATKEANLVDEHRVELSKNEIPQNCFADSAAFPTPSLNRTRLQDEGDLSTSRPATLESPATLERRDYADGNIPLTDRAKYLFRLGKSYVLFYKTGLKNVWANHKRARVIRQRFQGQAINTVTKYAGQTIDNKSIPEINRSEYQLCLRTRHDLLKMIPFSLVFLICGEFTPLVIVALGSVVVPYTCRIPQQESKDLKKRQESDKNYMEDLSRVYPSIETPLEAPDWHVEHLEAYRLGLTSFRSPIFVIGPLWHSLITRPKLIKHCDNVVADTLLIHRQGGAAKLTHLDLYEWANSYGLFALRQYIDECQKTGSDFNTEKLKTALLPKIDAEFKYMLEEVADWSKLKPNEQWRVGLRTVGSQSPDWRARVSHIRERWKQA